MNSSIYHSRDESKADGIDTCDWECSQPYSFEPNMVKMKDKYFQRLMQV